MKLTKKNFTSWLESLEDDHDFTYLSDECFFAQFLRCNGEPEALVGVKTWRKDSDIFAEDHPMPKWTVTCQDHFTTNLGYFLTESSVTAKEVLAHMRGIK